MSFVSIDFQKNILIDSEFEEPLPYVTAQAWTTRTTLQVMFIYNDRSLPILPNLIKLNLFLFTESKKLNRLPNKQGYTSYYDLEEIMSYQLFIKNFKRDYYDDLKNELEKYKCLL